MTSASNTGYSSEPIIGTLTAREIEILDLLVLVSKTPVIAKALRIAPRTVKGHLRHLFLKFRIYSGDKRVKLAVEWYYRLNPDKRI